MNAPESIPIEILDQAKRGSVDAFEYILSYFEKPIYNYCLRILRNTDDAKDATQQTFIKVYNNHKSIDSSKNIKTWIFTIATNTAYDIIRSRKRKNEVSLEEYFETIDDSQSYYIEESVISDVERAINEIDPDYSKVLLLFYQQGFSYQEIADITKTPINTIKTHISRGKEQIKEYLQNYGKC